MTKINDGGPAFPSATHLFNGMTKREEYASAAMAGILAGYWANPSMGGLNTAEFAIEAVLAADALIAALGAECDE